MVSCKNTRCCEDSGQVEDGPTRVAGLIRTSLSEEGSLNLTHG